MAKLILKDEVYAIVGTAMEVHREKGFGFSEPVYQECMEFELADRKVPAEAQKEMTIFYKGRQLKKTYLADFVAYGKIIVELKALDQLTSREESQVINYLKSSGLEVGVLINFGAPSLEWKRIVLTSQGPEAVDLQPRSKRN
ncbi:MAG: GxxExxY protein [Verrucomicrobiota bacterium]|jgi:GxxExxY protein